MDPMKSLLSTYRKRLEQSMDRLQGSAEDKKKRVERMRDWISLVKKNPPREVLESIGTELFGPESITFTKPKSRPYCDLCNDDGMYFSDQCQPRQHNHSKRTDEGWVVCRCTAGQRKNEGVRDMEKRKAGAVPRRGVSERV